MNLKSPANSEIRAKALHGLLLERYGLYDLSGDDLKLATQIRSLKMGEQDADKLKHGPPELLNATRNAQAEFAGRLYRAVINLDTDFLDQLCRVVRYFKRRDTAGLNPSEAAIRMECAGIAFESILKSGKKLPTRPQIKARLKKKGIHDTGINWARVWKSLELDGPYFAGHLGRPKKRRPKK